MPSLYRPALAEVRSYVERGVPVLIKGAMDDWSAPETWTFERLKALVGESSVLVQSRFGPRARDFDYRNVSFANVIDSTLNGGSDYLISSGVINRFPSLIEDIRIPEYVGARSKPPIVFVGPEQSFTPLHYDLHHGLLAQVRGHKEVAVFQFRRRDVLLQWELRGPARLSESLFSEASHSTGAIPARRWACTLVPRDLLFIPSGKHHCARSLDPSISLSFTWHTLPMLALSRVCKVVARV